MSEIEYAAALQHQEAFAQAKCGDLRVMADTILSGIGGDHSADDDLLWEADWTTANGDGFALRMELDDDRARTYFVEVVRGGEDAINFVIGFTPEAGRIILEAGEKDDEHDLDYLYYDDNPGLWVDYERELHEFLRSAPLPGLQALSPDGTWSQVFEVMMLWTVAEDKELIQYIGKYDPFKQGAKGRQAQRRQAIMARHGLNEEQFAQVVDLAVNGEATEEDEDGEA